VKSGASTKELLAALAEAEIAGNKKTLANKVTANVTMPPDYSLEAWERSNLADRIQEQRCGKDDGGGTPPISQIFNECIPLSNVTPLVAATEPSKGSLASFFSGSTSQAPNPSLGGAARDKAAGIAHCAFQHTPGHLHCDGQANVPRDAVPYTPSLLPLTLVLLARLSSHHRRCILCAPTFQCAVCLVAGVPAGTHARPHC
jgi:hypothetical protein